MLVPNRQFGHARFRFVIAIATVLLLLSPRVLSSQASSSEGDAASFQNLARQATAAREQGKSDEAIRYYQQALQVHPEWDEGWWYAGSLLYDSNRFAEALPAFSKVVELDPKLGPAWSFLGLCAYETKDYPNALIYLQKGHELGSVEVPEIAKVADYHLALLLIRNSEFERATALLTSEFVSPQASDQVKAALGLALLQVPLLPDAIDPSRDAVIAAAGGIAVLLAQKQQEQALQAFQQAIKDYPDTPYLHHAYGTALSSAGRLDEAQQQMRDEMRISPQSSRPYQALAAIQLQQHHSQDAVKSSEQAVKLAPHSESAYKSLAASLIAAGKSEEAATALAKSAELGPEEPQESKRVAQLYGRNSGATSSGSAQAKADVEPGTTNSASASFDQLAKQAVAARDGGKVDEAIRDYKGALQLRPTWQEGWWELSLIYFSGNLYSGAIDPLKHVVDLKPQFGTAWAMLGLSEYETGDFENALIHLEKAQSLGIQGSPDAIRIAQYHLAVLLNHGREFDRAVELLSVGNPEGSLTAQWNLAMGMGLLRVSLLPEQVQSARQPMLQAAGEAASLLATSRYDDAFVILQKLLKEYPNTPFLHYAYGSALASLSQYEEAEVQLRDEMKISPDSALPYIRNAFIALKTHNPADALTDAKRAVQLAPQSAEAHYILGRALLDSGQPQQAITELEIANGMMPNSPEIHFHLARAYSKAKQPDKAEQERATFASLNAIAERQRATRGSQAYGAAHEQSDLFLPAVAAPSQTATKPRQ